MAKKTQKNLSKQENRKNEPRSCPFTFSEAYHRKKEKLLNIMFGDKKSRKNGIYHNDEDSIL